MIGGPDGGMGGRYLSPSPRSSAHIRDHHRAGSFRRSPPASRPQLHLYVEECLDLLDMVP